MFSDDRFDLFNTPDSIFLRFLAEMLHPAVRPNREEADEIAREINSSLVSQGWRLEIGERVAGGYRYVAVPTSMAAHKLSQRAIAASSTFNSEEMRAQIARIERALDSDPALAIGTAKELVESCCKSLLFELQEEVPAKAELTTLTKLVAKRLQLVPEGVAEEAKGAEIIKRTLQNFSSITQNLAELRGLYGTGHGKDGRHRGLTPRHAKLAYGAAVTFVDFVTETYLYRSKPKESRSSRE